MILASRVAQVHRNQQSQGFQEQEHLPNIELKRAKWRSKNGFWATGQEPYCLTQNTHKRPFPKRQKKIHSLWHQWQIFASGIRGDLSSQHCEITMVVTIFTLPRAGPAGIFRTDPGFICPRRWLRQAHPYLWTLYSCFGHCFILLQNSAKIFLTQPLATRCLNLFLALPLICLGIHINATNSHIRVKELLIGTGSREYKTRTADLLVGSVTIIDIHYNDSDMLRGRDFPPDEKRAKCKSCFHKRRGFTKGELGKN